MIQRSPHPSRAKPRGTQLNARVPIDFKDKVRYCALVDHATLEEWCYRALVTEEDAKRFFGVA